MGGDMTKRKALAAVLLIMIFSACSKKPEAQKPEGENFFPQGKVGSSWEYLVRLTTPEGSKDGLLSIRIEGKETVNGKEYMKQATTLSVQPGAKPQVSYIRRTSEGIFKLDPASQDKSEVLLIPFPMKVGTTWTVKKADGQIISTAEKIEGVEFLGKTYKDCLKVTMHGESKSQPMEGVSYFAPGVGEVTTSLKIGKLTILYVLNKQQF
jgi:hypothetical protein